MSLKDFTDAYIEAALFASNDESTDSGGYPLDKNYEPSDIDAETLAAMKRDCEKFYADNEPIWSGAFLGRGDEDEQAGYDFWMTRNDHGVGFWEDDDWEEAAGKKLTAAAKKFGSFDLSLYSPSHPDWTPDMDRTDEDGDEVEVKIGGHPLRANRRRVKRNSRPKKRGSRRAKRTSRKKR